MNPMKQFLIYTRLRGRQVFRLFPAALLTALLLGAAAGLLLWMRTASTPDADGASTATPLNIGLVGVSTSRYLEAGMTILTSMDTSRYEARFLQMEQDEAMLALETGQLTAVIIIPDGFVSSLLSGTGERSTCTLVTGSAQAGLDTLLIEELSRAISEMISDMEASAQTLVQYCTALGGPTDRSTLDDLQTDLIFYSLQNVLKRSALFTVETPGNTAADTATLSTAGYYLTAMLLVLLLLSGILFVPVFVRRENSLLSLLRARHFPAGAQCAGEWLASGALLLSVFAVLLTPALLWLSLRTDLFPELAGSLRTAALLGATFLAVIPLAAARNLLLLELSDHAVTALFLHFALTVSLCFVSGCFYPVRLLPAALRKISPLLPTTQALRLLQSALTAEPAPIALTATLAAAALYLLLTAAVRTMRLTRDP